MTLQDLSLSDLLALENKYTTWGKAYIHDKESGVGKEISRRLQIIVSELRQREDVLFFQS